MFKTIKTSFSILIFSLIIFFACDEQEKTRQFTEKEKKVITAFSNQLLKSFQEFDPSFVKNKWSIQAFRKRITGLNKVQNDVLNYIMEEFVNNQIKFGNVSLVNEIYENSGKVYHSGLQHFGSYSELTLLLNYEASFKLLKYRIEFIKGKPCLSDAYDFRDNTWYSEAIKNNIYLNSRYNAFSEERRQANLAWNGYIYSLNRGDTLNAYRSLLDIPDTHLIGNTISIAKLNLAMSLGDSLLIETLVEESAKNESIYMRYLVAFYFLEESDMMTISEELSKETGNKAALDTLFQKYYFWQ